ncbi:hypothetical protein [uncultured Cardiobacterium sp.]|uniref:hypothetical protein n=1 Tax=uncultured Cardiobacterium sp. TaxID=417619 RepID=UPI0026256785|nr:hypothetical protein [uncultured Cardiobacterium sp.]
MITIYDIMQFIYWSYWGGMLVLLAIIIFAICKLIPAGGYRFVAIFCACIATPTFFILPLFEEDEKVKEEQTAYETRYAKARAIFDERCKTAGEKIYHTAENVEGITLLNVVPESSDLDFFDPMWERAALAWESSEMDYIKDYLMWEVKEKGSDKRGRLFIYDTRPGRHTAEKRYWGHAFDLAPDEEIFSGYRYVDVKQPYGRYRRYWYPDDAVREDPRVILRSPVKGKPSRYAVEYVPIIDLKDREEWIAGATINIYDMETDVLMASKTWYAFETGFGLGGQRMPWLEAISCPDRKGHDIRFFVDQVIKPKQGD